MIGCLKNRLDGRCLIHPTNLILMDLHMPEIGGMQASKEIREMCRKRNIMQPIIVAVTANAFPEDRQRCLEAGMNDYLAKPFDRADLVDLLSRTGLGPSAAAG